MKKIIWVSIVFSLLFSLCSKEKKSERRAPKMKEFIIAISKYAKGINPDFVIIPQNGVELLGKNESIDNGLDVDYINAIDGVGVEELFFDGGVANAADRDYRLSFLRLAKDQVKVMVSDYVSSSSDIAASINSNYQEGFIAFPRSSNNYDYNHIPDSVIHENSNDILKLSDAQNYLYYIGADGYASKSDMISAINQTNFDVVLIDLFFNDAAFTAQDINQMKTKLNGGKRLVISYINIGAAEKYRYYWKKRWVLHCPGWLKKHYDGYKDEMWVKFWKKEWQDIIYGNNDSYMKKILDAGFDGAYLDNVEAYYFLYNK